MNTFSCVYSKIVAIVPAAGIGSRMLSNIPKQYIKIRGCTILEHSIKFLLAHSSIKRIIIVLNKKDIFFHKLSISSHPRIFYVIGGDLRVCSVLSGLLVINDVKWVIIHDAVRPCLNYNDLNKIISLTNTSKIGGILATPVNNTIKYSKDNRNVISTISRYQLWNALTPQCFPIKLLLACLRKAMNEGINVTDEASAMEHCGYYPQLIRGSSSNIKVTYPEDISFVSFYLGKNFCKRKNS
ncbi:MAG: 2-C-methyl-D-erythritol 4-phosphate cytidylyltransferase [Buchnera aphidicola (Meitanaphis microgallis)]